MKKQYAGIYPFWLLRNFLTFISLPSLGTVYTYLGGWDGRIPATKYPLGEAVWVLH